MSSSAWIESLKQIWASNGLQDWVTALIAFLVTLLVLALAKRISVDRFTKLAERTKTQVDDVLATALSKTRFFFLFVIAFWLGCKSLALGDLEPIIGGFALLVTFVQAGIWANSILMFVVRHFVRLEIKEEASQVATTTALTFLGKLILWSLVLLLALENLGIDVTSLITGLGVGGIAVALAAQKVLGDLFASLSIMFDKPFVVGDFIIVDALMGTVERIGLKTTRVTSLSGEQLIFSNNDLLASRIKNYKRMRERRIVFSIGVTYQTPAEKLRLIPQIIKELIDADENARLDRSHFASYGDSSLNFETVYNVTAPDYNLYMDVQQRINLGLYERFEKEGIEFAYPTRTIFIEKGDEPEVKPERDSGPKAEPRSRKPMEAAEGAPQSEHEAKTEAKTETAGEKTGRRTRRRSGK
jgi:small-conductance mechanosensitive channel